MDRHDLERAARANSELKTAEENLASLLDAKVKVTAVTLDSEDRFCRPITLARGSSGTGSISGIGYSEALQAAITAALLDHFRAEVAKAKATLESLGIKIAA